ncbi:MAG: hypothetical protein J5654_09545 [Victivallales bacterium]|nr:hypothetical protein [Victivallales bacterium]
MSEIEKLVPPYELCKTIPRGEFTDSVFVWARYPEYIPCESNTIPDGLGEKVVMLRRDCLENNIIAPAPTIQEIWDGIEIKGLCIIPETGKNMAKNGLMKWLYFYGIKGDR